MRPMYASSQSEAFEKPAEGSPAPPLAEDRDRRIPTFRALQHRNFRLIWTGFAISSAGTWMQIVAQSLLVLDLTHGSAVALGTLYMVQALSFLVLAPIGGSTADRVDKRRLLLTTQSIMMVLASLLAVLTATGLIRFWIILLVACANSATLSFDQPARNALIAASVPKEHLMNAVSLQSAVFNGASLVGPALAGLTLSKAGYSSNFLLNALSYSAMLIALSLVDPSKIRNASAPGGKLLDSVREGLQYIRRDAVLPSVLAAYGALLFFGPSSPLMLPLFVKQILHRGSTELGLLFSAVGGGTVASALTLASLGDFRHKEKLVFGSILIWAGALAVFSGSSTLAFSIAVLVVLGATQTAAGATSVTLLQTRVPPEMRGRAMSLNTLLIMCVRPLGDFPAGALIGWLGLRTAILLAAAVVGTIVLTLFAIRPGVMKEPQRHESLKSSSSKSQM
jgi:MFS family permease